MSIPEVTDCIRIYSELHAQPFFKGGACPITPMVSSWKKLLFVSQKYVKKLSCVFAVMKGIVLHKHRLKKKRIYLSSIIRYALLLRYTSIQLYKMLLEDFPLPYLSLLSKIIKGKVDAIKYAQALKKDGKISEDICLLFDEMCLQKCEEYWR